MRKYFWEVNPLTSLFEIKRVLPDLTIETIKSVSDPLECQMLVDHIETCQLGYFLGAEGEA